MDNTSVAIEEPWTTLHTNFVMDATGTIILRNADGAPTYQSPIVYSIPFADGVVVYANLRDFSNINDSRAHDGFLKGSAQPTPGHKNMGVVGPAAFELGDGSQ